MPKAFFALCALGAASLPFAPIAAYGAPVEAAVPVGVTTTCSAARSDAPAAVTFAAPVDMPAIAKEMGFTGSSSIRIELASNGTLVAAHIVQSSGNALADAAALAAARASTFRPATVNCAPVGGAYLLLADLQ